MNNIIKFCQQENISLETMAYKIGKDIDLLKMWIDNDSIIPIKEAIQISSLLGYSLNELFLNTSSIDISCLNQDSLDTFISLFLPFTKSSQSFKVGLRKRNHSFSSQKDIADRIKFVRINVLGWSQTQLGKKLALSRSTIKDWENGMNINTICNIRNLAKISYISLDYFVLDNHPLDFNVLNFDNEEIAYIKQTINYLERQQMKHVQIHTKIDSNK